MQAAATSAARWTEVENGTATAAAPGTEASAAGKPVPRTAKTSTHQARIVAQNRRREYLNRNPTYFDNLEHELANPVLYERLVKRHQTPAEREADGKAKGYGRTLEADLVRGETKLADLRATAAAAPACASSIETSPATLDIDEAWDQEVTDKHEGLELWRQFVMDQFIRGQDDEFDYAPVDEQDDLDDLQHREAQEQWFDDEDPDWPVEHNVAHPQLSGETGIQDY